MQAKISLFIVFNFTFTHAIIINTTYILDWSIAIGPNVMLCWYWYIPSSGINGGGGAKEDIELSISKF